MIEITGVTKKYGNFKALDGIDLNITQGAIFGFIGPNGAGKTTTIRIISTLMRDFEGSVTVDGLDIKKDYEAIRMLIGYMPDFVGAYKQLTVYEYLEFFGRAYNIEKSKLKKIISDCIELTDLTTKTNEPAAGLSRGMTQRLLLAKTLIHNPKILLLDEPASGLDPRARIEFKEIIKLLSSMNKTVLISSHILAELSDICDSVGIIEQGKIVAQGPIQKIKQMINKHSQFKIKRIGNFTGEEIDNIEKFENVLSCEKKNDAELTIEFSGSKEQAAAMLNSLCSSGIPIIGFSELETNLEDVFMKITRGIVS